MNDNVTLRTNQLIDEVADYAQVQQDCLNRLLESLKAYEEFVQRSLRDFMSGGENKYER